MLNFLNDIVTSGMDFKMFISAFILFSFVVQAIFMRIKNKGLYLFVLYNLLVFCLFYYVFKYDYRIYFLVFIPSLFLSFILYGLLPDKNQKRKEIDSWKVIIKVVKGEPLVLENIKRGMAVFGSAGAGKTESVFVPLIDHCAKHGLGGISYDYKDGELTEIINYFYANCKTPVYSIVPHKPELSYRINPVHPSFVSDADEIAQLVAVLFDNTRSSGIKSDPFWDSVPEAALCGVLWRLHCDFPDYCTLPHAIAVCVNSNPLKLGSFISQNRRASILGRPFLDSLTAKEQLTGVKASLSNVLRKFCFPSLFYVLTGNEVDLAVNKQEKRAMLNLVNCPGKEDVYNPFLAMIFSAAINAMRERNRSNSVLLLDEAATMAIKKFSRIPATLRSYNVATIYSLQDKVLGEEQLGTAAVKSILANLSYIFAGKVNDPDSIKYYKQIMEEVEETKISKNYGSGMLSKGETRMSESRQRTNKYKNQDYAGLKAGEFLVMADGKDRKVKFSLMPFEKISMKVRNHITKVDLENHFDKILDEAEKLLENIED